MLSGLADEIAAAAAVREHRRKEKEQQQQQQLEMQGTTGPDATPPLHPPSTAALPPSQAAALTSPPRGKADPPGWDSHWSKHPRNSIAYMQERIAQANAQLQQKPRTTVPITPYHDVRSNLVSGADDDDSFMAPMSTWVPQVDKEQRKLTTTWPMATQETLKTAVPVQSWSKVNDNERPESEKNSWAPHLHPNGPQALAPSHFPTSKSSCEFDEEEILEDDDEEDDDDGDMIEIVDEEEGPSQMSRKRKKKKKSKSSSFSSSSSSSRNSSSYSSDSSSSGFLRANKTRNATQQSLSSATASSEVMEQEQQQSDYTTYLVDSDDTFQCFDENWRFAPSRGTLCLIGLMIVLALEGLAVGLYFVLRD
mmetsp:Transcript_28208/g.49997  ORF Transcript_28208/g.49997 Transcript_28208/m.49997 type:complete len:365 (-) Transcript_28208:304-1398(-)